MKKILIIGGGGYIGTELCNYLNLRGFKVICLDTFWFGNYLDKKIKIIKHDIRELKNKFFKNIDVVINLAYLANDPLCEVNARDTWEIGPLSLYQMMEYCVKNKVKKFIFASSGCVYGIKKEKNVTENLSLEPMTDYNKSKMICEKIIQSYDDKIKNIILRPATVCGFSKRLRLDVVLNLFCYQAFYKKKISIFGGNQIRPLINIKDMIRAYEFFISKNFTGCFNAGFENVSVKKIAEIVQKVMPCKIEIIKSHDPRTYRMNSSKLFRTGFKSLFNAKDAVHELKNEFEKGFKPKKINWNLDYLINKRKIVKTQ